MKKMDAKQITLAALAIAVVCVSTMVIQIPIPLGYMHLGNCCILQQSNRNACRRRRLVSGRSFERLSAVDSSNTDYQRHHGLCHRGAFQG